MAAAKGPLAVAVVTGTVYSLSASVPSLADNYIVRTTATFNFTDDGVATPGTGSSMWVAPGETGRSTAPASNLRLVAQGAGVIVFHFYQGGF
jgi:hypothetical protein